jgi:uncharacterized membrane protein
MAMVWWGMAATQWFLRKREFSTSQTALLASPLVPGLRPLAFLGRWSLSYYMAHQPVLIALVMAAAWWAHRSP